MKTLTKFGKEQHQTVSQILSWSTSIRFTQVIVGVPVEISGADCITRQILRDFCHAHSESTETDGNKII